MLPQASTLIEIWQRTVSHHSARPALRCEGVSLSYAELDAWSDWICLQISVEWCQGTGCRIGLWMDRSPAACAAILGILKAGASYVPLDLSCPQERAAFIAQDARLSLILTDASIKQPLLSQMAQLGVAHWEVPMDWCGRPGGGPVCRIYPTHEAYVCYTSGTTGRPKGVAVSHGAVAHFVESERALFDLGPEDRVWHGLSLAFDASMEELWLAWSHGAELIIGSARTVRDTTSLPDKITSQGVTVLSTVPTLLSMLQDDLPTVRLLITGGEALTAALVDKWAPGRRLVNTYGPTEAAVVVTAGEVSGGAMITLGLPLRHVSAYVVDPATLEAAMTGELWVSGPMLAEGYVGLPTLTEEKFPQHPTWGRCYRTGDLVEALPDGRFAFLGRLDSQVKLRGFRIELEEIDTQLRAVSLARGAACAVQQDALGHQRLVAFIVAPAQGDEAGWKQRLGQVLPTYMVPERISVVEALPTTLAGKLDRAALPQLPVAAVDTESVEGLWRVALAINENDVLDETADFFTSYNGTSLSAAWLVSRLRRLPGWGSTSVADLYTHSTLGALRSLSQEPSRSATKVERSADFVQEVLHARRHRLAGLFQAACLPLFLILMSLPWWWTGALISSLRSSPRGIILVVGLLAAVAMIPQVSLAVSAIISRTLVGGLRPGVYPVWGVAFCRYWLATRLTYWLTPTRLSGTPWAATYGRWLGARIGLRTHVDTLLPVGSHLIDIGSDVLIHPDAMLAPIRIIGREMMVAPIVVGQGAVLGTRSFVDHGASIPDGHHVGAGERWDAGAGNQARTADSAVDSRQNHAGASGWCYWPFWVLLQAPRLVSVVGSVLMVRWTIPGWWQAIGSGQALQWITHSPGLAAAMALLATSLSWMLYVLTTAALFRMASFARSVVSVPMGGWAEARAWFIQALWKEVSTDMFPLASTIYSAPLMRLMGAKVGRGVEISTAEHVDPSRLTLANGAFIADAVSLGASLTSRDSILLGEATVGRRTFAGNNAVVPPGIVLGDHVLLGVLSVASPAMTENGSAWLGAPAFHLKNRSRSTAFGDEVTYSPSAQLIVLRGVMEALRVLIPSFVGSAAVMGFIALLPLVPLWLLAGIFALGLSSGWLMLVWASKWSMTGRVRPSEFALWSPQVWALEWVACWFEWLAWSGCLHWLGGTPFLPWYYQAMGAQFGKRVYCDTPFLTEPDLVSVGDDSVLEAACDPQTHLFEDRIFKCGRVTLGRGASLGTVAVALPESHLEDQAILCPLSLLMKGESLPAATQWAGSPARRIAEPSVILGHGSGGDFSTLPTAGVSAGSTSRHSLAETP